MRSKTDKEMRIRRVENFLLYGYGVLGLMMGLLILFFVVSWVIG